MHYDPGAGAREYLAKQADRETARRLRVMGVDPQTLRAVAASDDSDQIEARARQVVDEHQKRKNSYGW